MNAKMVGVAAAVAVVSTITLVVVLGGRDDNNDDEAIASQISGESPTAEARPTESATRTLTDAVEHFALELVTDELEFVRGGVADVPDGLGIYILDLATNRVEGWHAPGEDLYAGLKFSMAPDNRLAAVEVLDLGAPIPATERPLLADRETQKVYGWNGEARPLTQPEGKLVAAASRVLIQFPAPDNEDEGWFAVVDVDAPSAPVGAFQSEAWSGLLSPDGARAVLVGERVHVFDVDAGTILWDADIILPELSQQCLDFVDQLRQRGLEGDRIVRYEIRNTLGSEGFLLTTHPACPQDANPTTWLHYRWQGELLAHGTREVFPSPAGDKAWVETALGELPITEALDLQDGGSLFRVVGAAPGRQFPVVLLPRQGQRIWATATLGGGINQLAAHGATDVRPAPGESDVFSRRALDLYVLAFDLQGNELGGYAPDPGASFQGASFGIAPWGDVPGELRFIAGPRGSDDCCPSWSLVAPYVEEPPYAAEPMVELREEAIGAAIRDAAAGNTLISNVSTLTVRVLGSERLNTEPSDPANNLHCELVASQADFETDCRGPYTGLWLHIITEDGINGWLLVEAGPVGP